MRATGEDLEAWKAWVAELNAAAEPFVPLLICRACEQPIEDTFVAVWHEGPMIYHLACDPNPPDVPGAICKRVP